MHRAGRQRRRRFHCRLCVGGRDAGRADGDGEPVGLPACAAPALGGVPGAVRGWGARQASIMHVQPCCARPALGEGFLCWWRGHARSLGFKNAWGTEGLLGLSTRAAPAPPRVVCLVGGAVRCVACVPVAYNNYRAGPALSSTGCPWLCWGARPRANVAGGW